MTDFSPVVALPVLAGQQTCRFSVRCVGKLRELRLIRSSLHYYVHASSNVSVPSGAIPFSSRAFLCKRHVFNSCNLLQSSRCCTSKTWKPKELHKEVFPLFLDSSSGLLESKNEMRALRSVRHICVIAQPALSSDPAVVFLPARLAPPQLP